MKHYILSAALTAAFLLASGGVSAQAKKGPEWLKDAVFYQIYPSSFMDSDGNGIGDLPGITSKLDYVSSLGVNAIWLNPIYLSPFDDGGYDIIDFYTVDPRFGTNTDLVNLVRKAHSLGIKVMLDLVAGHTSDKCPWFLESMKKDPNGRYSDYYIWTDSISEADRQGIIQREKGDDPASTLGGNWVEKNAPRARYYQKNYYPSQPALNYGYAHPNPNNPWEQSVDAPGPRAVKREMKNIMSFWFDKGVDGFRVDLASIVVKNDRDRREVTRLWNEMRRWMDENYPDHALLSEWSHPTISIPAGFNMDFYMTWTVKGYSSLFVDADAYNAKQNVDKHAYFERAGLGKVSTFVSDYSYERNKTLDRGFICLPTGNHDMPRLSNGERKTSEELKVAMTFFLTMPGVPLIYYGDEIGMRFIPNMPSKEGGLQRTGTRTPMQWSAGPTAGFSTCVPDSLYLPVFTDNGRLTVAAQESDKGSLLNYVRLLTSLRHSSTALQSEGEWTFLSDTAKPYPMVYKRSNGSETYIIALNPSAKRVSATIASQTSAKPKPVVVSGKAKFSVAGNTNRIDLGPCSAAIFRVAR